MKVKIVDGSVVRELTEIGAREGEIGYLELTTEKPEVPEGTPTYRHGGIDVYAPYYIKAINFCKIRDPEGEDEG